MALISSRLGFQLDKIICLLTDFYPIKRAIGLPPPDLVKPSINWLIRFLDNPLPTVR